MGIGITAISGGVTAARGFRAAGLHCGIKANGRPDLSLVVCDTTATAAGLFTLNLAQAAPVLVSKAHLTATGGRARGVVTNSGCANACTGPQGLDDAREMAALTAATLGCAPDDVLVASTGVIGVNLKMPALRSGIPRAAAALGVDGAGGAARPLLKTQTVPN
jgi:glutamate N-acetyltransferase / amino-acid N-acetyltransferase